MYSGIWWGAQSSVNLLLLHFKNLVFKWCLPTLNYPIFLVPLGWKIFFVAPCYYLSLKIWISWPHICLEAQKYITPNLILPSWWETFVQTSFRRADRCTVYKTQPTWGMGKRVQVLGRPCHGLQADIEGSGHSYPQLSNVLFSTLFTLCACLGLLSGAAPWSGKITTCIQLKFFLLFQYNILLLHFL